MRLDIPNLTGKELFSYLKENKKELISKKKSMPIFSESLSSVKRVKPEMLTSKSENEEGKLVVEVVANLSNWMDSHQDVMLPNSWNKSIADKGNSIPMLKDHDHSVSAIIAKTLDVFTRDLSIKDLGFDSDVKKSQALVFKIEPRKEFDAKLFELYKAGEVTQHSIGLQYLNIELAINDKDEKEEFAVWEKYYPQVINKEEADKFGFFWAVKEAKIFENSAVLFGANSMTPTLSVTESSKSSTQNNEPPLGTQSDNEPQTNKSFYTLILNRDEKI